MWKYLCFKQKSIIAREFFKIQIESPVRLFYTDETFHFSHTLISVKFKVK